MARNAHNIVSSPPIDASSSAEIKKKLLSQLETAAMAGDGLTVLKVGDRADWSSLTAEELVAAVRLVLRVNAVQLARALSSLGAERFPDDAELQKIAHILAPPKVTSHGQADPRANANMSWLKENRQRYRGKWVALLDGELLAVADTPLQIQQAVGPVQGTRFMVTSVWKRCWRPRMAKRSPQARQRMSIFQPLY